MVVRGFSVIFLLNSTLITSLKLFLCIQVLFGFSYWFLFIFFTSKFWSAQGLVFTSLPFPVPFSKTLISSSLMALNTFCILMAPNSVSGQDLSPDLQNCKSIQLPTWSSCLCLIGIPNLILSLTEILVVSHKPASPEAFPISVNACCILLVAWARNIGAIFDSSLTPNIWSVSKSC